MSKRMASQPSLKLYYFNITGKGEAIRLFCAYAGLELEDYRFADREEFTALKADGTLPYGQVPLLEVDKTTRIPQSAAILRYLAKIAGGDLYPSDPIQAARVDAALDQEADAFVGPTVASYTVRFGIELSDSQVDKAAALLSAEVMPRHFASIEAQLKASSSGWIADTKCPSPADFVWACRFGDYLPTKDRLFTPELRDLEAFPACRAFVKRFYELPQVAEYYKRKEG
ncbi:unnamed protein product [Effrenium voratum]|uniref:Glutathione S-transferase n=1 Tax=Effrenium voratum TaxID=2562239 RepID=A0AA36N6B7_9DINO|nr:unnamed protein product [Effrenium voratum]